MFYEAYQGHNQSRNMLHSCGCVRGMCYRSGEPDTISCSTGTAIPVSHLVVNESQNTATVYMNKGNLITVKLAENPTTGFQWNLTTTPGLRIVKDHYVPTNSSTTLVGSGGTHVWDISTEMIGEQKIMATYKRPWELVSGNESVFSMTVVVA